VRNGKGVTGKLSCSNKLPNGIMDNEGGSSKKTDRKAGNASITLSPATSSHRAGVIRGTIS